MNSFRRLFGNYMPLAFVTSRLISELERHSWRDFKWNCKLNHPTVVFRLIFEDVDVAPHVHSQPKPFLNIASLTSLQLRWSAHLPIWIDYQMMRLRKSFALPVLFIANGNLGLVCFSQIRAHFEWWHRLCLPILNWSLKK